MAVWFPFHSSSSSSSSSPSFLKRQTLKAFLCFHQVLTFSPSTSPFSVTGLVPHLSCHFNQNHRRLVAEALCRHGNSISCSAPAECNDGARRWVLSLCVSHAAATTTGRRETVGKVFTVIFLTLAYVWWKRQFPEFGLSSEALKTVWLLSSLVTELFPMSNLLLSNPQLQLNYFSSHAVMSPELYDKTVNITIALSSNNPNTFLKYFACCMLLSAKFLNSNNNVTDWCPAVHATSKHQN